VKNRGGELAGRWLCILRSSLSCAVVDFRPLPTDPADLVVACLANRFETSFGALVCRPHLQGGDRNHGRCGWHSRLIDGCECVLSSPSRRSLLYCFPNGIMISSESLSCPSRIHGAKGLRWQSYNVCSPTTKDESQALASASYRIAPSAGNSKLEMVKRLLPFRAEPWSFGHESKNGRPSFGQQACSTPGRLTRNGVGRNLSERRRPFT
jgi:hypothetical protein